MTPECSCSACQALAKEYANDPKMLAYLMKNLLIRGWAGSTSPTEKAYQRKHAGWSGVITPGDPRNDGETEAEFRLVALGT